MKPRRLILPATVVFSLASATGGLHAQIVYDWMDTAPDANWTQGAGGARWWDGSTGFWNIPPAGGVLRFNNDHELTMTNNAGTYSASGLVFGSSSTAARTLGGDAVRLYDFGGADPFIRNESSATHIFNLNLEGDGDAGDPLQIQLNGSGGLTFNGTINNQGSWIDVVGSTTSAATTTFNGVVSGSGGIYKGNAFTTLVLANSGNTYSGGTTISAGTVSFANGALGTTGSITVNGGTLQWATGNTQDISGRLTLQNSTTATLDTNGNNVTLATAFGSSTSASLTKAGNGILTLSGANAYTGTTNVNGGTLRLGNAAGLGTSSLVTVASGATLDVAGFASGRPVEISGTGVSGTAALHNSSITTSASVSSLKLNADATISNLAVTSGTPDWSKPLSISGVTDLNGKTLTISGGVITVGGGRSIGSGDIVINSGGILASQNGGSLTSVTGTITINSGGKFETRDFDNTAMTSVHTIALNGGTISRATLQNNNGGGGGTILKNNITVDAINGGTITNNTGSFSILYRLAGSISGTGALNLNGSMGVEFQGDASGYTGTATATGGTVSFNTSGSQVFGGILAGTRPVQKVGNGTTTFAGANTYTGATTVSAGTLVLAGANTGNTAVTVGSGATLRLDYSTQDNSKLHDTPSLSLNGATVELSGGTHTEVVGGVSLGANTNVSINRSSGSSVLQMNTITRGANATLSFGASGIATTDTLNTNGILGTWATIAGSDWAVNSTNATDGLITAPNYTLTSVALDSAVNYTDAHMSVDSNQTPGGAVTPYTLNYKTAGAYSLTLTGTNTIKAGGILVTADVGNNASVLTGGNLQTGTAGGDLAIVQNNTSNSLTIGSVIQNNTSASSLTKRGAGTLVLSGVNTYTGNTNVIAGTLQFGNANAIATSGLAMSGGTADLAGVNPSVLGLRSEVASAGTITNSAAGTGTNTLSITGGWWGNFSGVIQNGATAKTAVVLSGTNGRISWSGNNTFTGGLTINGSGNTDGTDSGVILGISGDGALGGTANVITLNNGGTLFNGTSTTGGWSASSSPTLAGGRSIVMGSGAGGVFRVWGGSTFTVNSTISGSGALTKTDGGTLALGGANTYTGVTTVREGTIRMDNGQAFGSYVTGRPVTQVVIASGGAIDLNAKAATYGYTIAGTGVGGTGALTNSSSTAIANTQAQTSNIKLSGNATIGGSGNWSLLTNSYAATSLDLGGFTLTKAGANTISLVSTTTTAGSIQVNAGGLAFGVTNGGSGVVGDATSLTLANTSGVSLALNRNSSIGSLSGGGATGGSVALGSSTLTIGALNSNTTYSGVVSGTGTLTKVGTGTLTLTGANNYTGATTTLSGGGITLDFSASGAPAANILNNTSNSTALSMGGGTLTLIGKASTTNSQRLNGLTLTGGANTIALNANATANPLLLTLGTITRTGGSINFTLPAGVQSATNGITTTSSNDATGILGTWATVGGTDFAAVSSANIVAYSGYADVKRLDASANSIVSGSSSNVRIVEGSGTPFNIQLGSPTTTINTLTQSASAGSGAATIDPDATNTTLAVGSVLLAGNAGSLTIGSTSGDGILMAASAGGTLILNNQSATNPLTANSVVGNNTSASGLLKTGPGTVVLNGSNTYTGATTVSQGKLRVTNTAGMGAAGNAVSLGGGTLELATDSAVSSKNLTLSASSTIILDRATPGAGFSTSFGGITFGDSHTLTVVKGANVTSGNATLNFTGFPALGAAGKTAGFDIGSGAEVELSGNLSGTQQFARITKAGSGTLILSGSNDWWDPANSSGLVTVTGGTLDLRSANAMGDGTTGANSIALSMAASTTLRLGTNSVLNNHADLTLTATGVTISSDRATAGAGITNQFDVLSIGAHTLNVTGGTNVTSGTTQVNFNTAVLEGNAVFNVTNPAATGTVTTLQIGAVSGTGFGLTKNGSGVLALNGANTYTGTTTVSGGTLQLGSGGTGGALSTSSSISVASGATFSVNQTDTVTQGMDFSGSAISGAGAFAQSGSGTTILNTANSYSGRTTITAGTLSIGADNNLGTAPGTATAGHLVINGGTLSVGTTFNLASNRGIAVGPTTGTGSGTISVATGQTLTYGGIVANNGGTGQLIKAGSGSLVLSGSGSWSGTTTVNGGTLEVQAKNGNVSYTVAQGATLRLGYSTGGGYTPGITLNGNGVADPAGLYLRKGITFQTNGGLLIQTAPTRIQTYGTGSNAAIGGFDVNADYFLRTTAAASGSVVDADINVNTNSYGYKLQADAGANTATGDLVIMGVISGSGTNNFVAAAGVGMGLDKMGSGSLKLTAQSTYSGGTWIAGGSIILSGGDNRLPTSTVVVTGSGSASGKLVLGDSAGPVNQTVAALHLNGSGTANAVVGGNASISTLSVNNSTDRTYGGTLGGTGTHENNLAFTKSGAGTLTLTGTNTYVGNTAVNEGRLNVNGSITSAASVAAGAFLGGDGSINGTLNLAGTLLPGQGGSADRSLTINGNVTTTTGSAISFKIDAMNSHDQLVIGAGGAIGLGNADLDVTFDNALTFTNLVAGEGADFLTAISGNDFSSINATWFRIIEGTTTGMFANVTDTLNSSELAYLGLSGTQYAYNADNGQRFWVAGGSTYLVAIPEPSAAVILPLGLLVLLRRRRA